MVVPAGAKVEDVVEAVPESVQDELVPAVEVKQASKKEKKKNKMEIQEVEAVHEPVEVVDSASFKASSGRFTATFLRASASKKARETSEISITLFPLRPPRSTVAASLNNHLNASSGGVDANNPSS